MIVKNYLTRRMWWLRTKLTKDPELAKAYLRRAEEWADLIEMLWVTGGEFGIAAQEAHTRLLGEFSTFTLHEDPCDFLVFYLKETWEFGNQLSEWYESLPR